MSSIIDNLVNKVSSTQPTKFRYFQAANTVARRPNVYMVGITNECAAVSSAAVNLFTPLLASIGIKIDSAFNIQGVQSFRVEFKGPSLPLDQLSKIPCVAYIEDDVFLDQHQVNTDKLSNFAATENACLQTPAMDSTRDLWGLDAIDGKLNDHYSFDLTGEGVNVYVVDSGIRTSHPEFEGRAKNIFSAKSVLNQNQEDCTGHGTHVAGLIGGRTVGVAKKVNLFGLRIIDCARSGSVSDAVEALNFLSSNMQRPAVVNVSLGSTDGLRGDTLPRALSSLARSGAAISIAAGNSQVDVCDTSQPSMTTIPSTFVVGALDKSSSSDSSRGVYRPRIASFSNTGSCVQWWAPGVDIWSSSNVTVDVQGSELAYEQRQGTSQAAPLMAGVLSLHLGMNPNLTPAELQALLIRDSVPLPQVSATARHVIAPRAVVSSPTGQSAFARTQAVPPAPFTKCDASRAGFISTLSDALNTSHTVVIILICLIILAAIGLGFSLYIRKRRALRDAEAQKDVSLDSEPVNMTQQQVPLHA